MIFNRSSHSMIEAIPVCAKVKCSAAASNLSTWMERNFLERLSAFSFLRYLVSNPDHEWPRAHQLGDQALDEGCAYLLQRTGMFTAGECDPEGDQ
jgi:hypothetical protein